MKTADFVTREKARELRAGVPLDTPLRFTAEELCECSFIEEDGTLHDPGSNPYVPMPDPKVRDGPCPIWIVPAEGLGYFPTEVGIASWEEAEKACDAANIQIGWSLYKVDLIILASMGGGTS